MFRLHPQLAKDCILIGRFELCLLLLMNDRQYPWFILVPQRQNISEIYQLSAAEQQSLWQESAYLSMTLAQEYAADKMNVAALGNVVPQLHIHHIVRYRADPSWPAPVWGKLPPKPYSAGELEELMMRLKSCLGNHFYFNQGI